MPNATTLVRIGIMPQKLLFTVRRFDLRFELQKSPTGISEQCKLVSRDPTNPYIIIVSKGPLEKGYDYNSVFTATSYSQQTNLELYTRFSQKTGLNFRESSGFLDGLMQGLSDNFEILIRDPEERFPFPSMQ